MYCIVWVDGGWGGVVMDLSEQIELIAAVSYRRGVKDTLWKVAFVVALGLACWGVL